jgi:HSP20 family protein
MAKPNGIATKEASAATAPEATRGGVHYAPRVDIYENAEELVLLCDMPGVKPQDLDVRFEKGELAVYGKVQARQTPTEYLLDEYSTGDYFRSFTIGAEVDAAKIAAEYRDGVLTVHLPKQEKAKPKRIAVKAS